MSDFSDLDIKELLCPIDMNFQKPTVSNSMYKQTNRTNENKLNQTRNANFLKSNYKKMYEKDEKRSSAVYK
jgi:hypothetical protein